MKCSQCERDMADTANLGDDKEPICWKCYLEKLNDDPIAKSLFGVSAGLTDTEEYLE